VSRTYQFIFLKFYLLLRSAFGERDGPEYSALLAMSLLAWLNLVGIVGWFRYFGFEVAIFRGFSSVGVLFLVAVVILAHYSIFLRGARLAEIEREYDAAVHSGSNTIPIITALYAVGSVSNFVVSMLVSAARFL
jgi:hypothetical protein